jgi:hypothetical protein
MDQRRARHARPHGIFGRDASRHRGCVESRRDPARFGFRGRQRRQELSEPIGCAHLRHYRIACDERIAKGRCARCPASRPILDFDERRERRRETDRE